jgi:hypothetical protein
MTHEVTPPNDFGGTPDERLGALLREHLAPAGHAAFVGRVRAAIAAEPATSWDVLARWARPGVAAAAGILLALGLLFGLAQPSPSGVSLADAAQAAGVPAVLVADASSTDVLLAAVVGDE